MTRPTPSACAQRLGDIDILVVCHGAPYVDDAMLDAAPRLKLIGELEGDRFANRIDVEAAAERGVRVTDTTHGSSLPVAEWALALMLIGLPQRRRPLPPPDRRRGVPPLARRLRLPPRRADRPDGRADRARAHRATPDRAAGAVRLLDPGPRSVRRRRSSALAVGVQLTSLERGDVPSGRGRLHRAADARRRGA